MELKEGKISLKDLALWFGKSERYFSNASDKMKQKMFETLKTFAVYHFEGKRLYIDKVKYPVFTKAFDIIEEEFPKHWGRIVDEDNQLNTILKQERIDTCARVGKEIWRQNDVVQSQIQVVTAKKYANEIKVKHYGHNHLNDHGTKGRSEYVWMNEDGSAPLSKEQIKILNDCVNKAYNSMNTTIVAIDEDYHKGIISKTERDKAVGEIDTTNNYDRFVTLVCENLGFIPEKRTKLIDTREWIG